MAGALPTFDIPYTLGAHIEARAGHSATANRVLARHGERSWTYAEYRDHCVRYAHFLLQRLGTVDASRPGHVAVLLENHLEFLAIYGGCAFAGLTLFGINTGLRGETLAGVLNQSGARVLIVDAKFLPQVEQVRQSLKRIAPENVLVYQPPGTTPAAANDLVGCVRSEIGAEDRSLDAPDVTVAPDQNLMVIYTSGTTGLPKGINNNHFKLLATGIGVSNTIGLGLEDVAYISMPLFHSNSMFVGFSPAFWVGGSVGIRERFSASRFVPDVLEYGATYWNYVGEPVHYVLAAIEREYGPDEDRILAAVARDSRNRMRYAVGNGASPPDIDRFMTWLGLEDMFELYGSTEAAISTFRRKGDPRGSVGEVLDPAVKILDERGRECPPAELDAAGAIRNYAEAVGEICKVAPDTGLFQGYFDNPEANRSKYRDGIYHSGDLGHILLRDGKRYLYFDGRTDDWIRKDGENFSAAPIGRIAAEHPDVRLAAAYGVPCAVSDELVMVALKLREGVDFDPEGLHAFFQQQVRDGGMDPKWVPDFVRLVEDFEYTNTQKILVRNLKREHFDLRRLPDVRIFRTQRGDTTYRPFATSEFDALYREFQASERAELLDR